MNAKGWHVSDKVSLHTEAAKDTAAHNDRSLWDEKVIGNRHWDRYDCHSSVEAERRFYEEQFGQAHREQMERHRASGNWGRVKSFDEWMYAHGNAPHETIIQLGSQGSVPSDDYVRKAFHAFKDYAEKCGLDVMSADIHNDEQSPHIHIRWTATNPRNGKPGVADCLAAHGVKRPKPDKKRTMRNNELATFTADVRTMLEDLAEQQGYDVDRTRDSTAKHMSVKKYKQAKEEMKGMLDGTRSEASAIIEQAKREAEAIKANAETTADEIKARANAQRPRERPQDALQGMESAVEATMPQNEQDSVLKALRFARRAFDKRSTKEQRETAEVYRDERDRAYAERMARDEQDRQRRARDVIRHTEDVKELQRKKQRQRQNEGPSL